MTRFGYTLMTEQRGPKAGFTDIAVVQVGDQGQSEFLEKAAGPPLEKPRALS